MVNPEKRPLKIAYIAPLVTPITSPFLGGAQVLLHDLAQGMAARGHRVTVFAAKGSAIPGVNLVEIPVDSSELKQADFSNRQQTGASPDEAFYRQAELFLGIFLDINLNGDFDIVHAHAYDWPVYAFASLCKVPVVHTLHLPAVDRYITNVIRTVFEKTGKSNCVTVSEACAATYAEDFAVDSVIYNGIKVENIPFGAEPEDYVLYAGRISPEKGPDIAIEIARQAGVKLLLAGGIYDRDYYNNVIEPLLEQNSNTARYLGVMGRDQVYSLMSRAKGVIFPSTWQEPFGLVIAEAQTAGAPVIAFNVGAAPEIIRPGATGFLVSPENLTEAVEAVSRLGEIDRAACRRHIAKNFSFEKMLNQYENYYYRKIS